MNQFFHQKNQITNGMVLLLMVMLSVTAAKRLSGQEESPSELSRQLAPVFDEGVMFFARIHLAKVDWKQAETKLRQWFEIPAAVSMKPVESLMQTIQNAGGENIFATFSLVDTSSLPIIAIPVQREFDSSMIIPIVKSLGEYEVRYLKDRRLVVLASSEAFKRIDSGDIPTRKDIGQLIPQETDEVVSINFVPSADHRRVLLEFEPQFSGPFAPIDGPLLGNGLKSASLVLNSIQPFDLKFRVDSEDREAARKFKLAVSSLMSQIPEKGIELDFFRKVERNLFLSAKRPGLVLQIDEDKEEEWKKAIKPFFAKAKFEVQQSDEVNNLKLMLLGMHNFYDANRGFPDVGMPKDNGSPGLSWRVHILPYIGETELYEKFRLDEAWDSDHNKKLIAEMPKVYQVASPRVPAGQTTYVMPRGKGYFASPFAKKGQEKKGVRGRRFQDILDGTSNTIAVLQVASDRSVVWTKPEDWNPVKEKLLAAIKEEGRDRVIFATGDGAVHQLPMEKLTNKRFQAMLTIADGEIVSFD